MTRPTIANVARLAGASKSTVSRVLSGNADICVARPVSAWSKRLQSLAIAPAAWPAAWFQNAPLLPGCWFPIIGNPFYPEVINDAEDVALKQGCNIFLCSSNYDLERGMTLVRSLIDKQVDGVLVMSSTMSDEWVQELARHNVPVVVLDWEPQAIEGTVGSIRVYFKPGIRAAIGHLVELGHRHIAHVSGPLHLRTSQLRQDAFLQAVAAHNINPQQITILEGNLQIDGGKAALVKLLTLPEHPTAVFAANDLMAMGIVRAARAERFARPR